MNPYSRPGCGASRLLMLNKHTPPIPPTAPPFQGIADLVHEHAQARPHDLALMHGERRVTWAQVDAMADRIAASLQRDGLKPQESIAICGVNSLEYAALFLGGLRAGAAVAPVPAG